MLQGSIVEFPVSDIFRLLSFTKKTGKLEVLRTAGDGQVFFRDGEVYYAASSLKREPVGQKLVRSGALTETQLRTALDLNVETGERVGEILLRLGEITEDQLIAGVRLQIEEAVCDLLSWERGEFSFEDHERFEAEIPISVSVDNLIIEATRRTDELEVIRRKIPSNRAILMVAPTPPEGAHEINITPGEWRMLALVDGHRDVEEILQYADTEEFEGLRTLYGLLSSGLIAVSDMGPVEVPAADTLAESVTAEETIAGELEGPALENATAEPEENAWETEVDEIESEDDESEAEAVEADLVAREEETTGAGLSDDGVVPFDHPEQVVAEASDDDELEGDEVERVEADAEAATPYDHASEGDFGAAATEGPAIEAENHTGSDAEVEPLEAAVVEAERVDPVAVEPGVVDPEVVDPEVVDPEAVDPEPVESAAAEPVTDEVGIGAEDGETDSAEDESPDEEGPNEDFGVEATEAEEIEAEETEAEEIEAEETEAEETEAEETEAEETAAEETAAEETAAEETAAEETAAEEKDGDVEGPDVEEKEPEEDEPAGDESAVEEPEGGHTFRVSGADVPAAYDFEVDGDHRPAHEERDPAGSEDVGVDVIFEEGTGFGADPTGSHRYHAAPSFGGEHSHQTAFGRGKFEPLPEPVRVVDHAEDDPGLETFGFVEGRDSEVLDSDEPSLPNEPTSAEPVPEEPEVEPVLEETAIDQVQEEPEAKPVPEEPAVEPVQEEAEEPEIEPVQEEAEEPEAEQPEAEQPEAEPVHEEPEAEEPQAEPVHEVSAVEPVHEEPELEPVQEESAPAQEESEPESVQEESEPESLQEELASELVQEESGQGQVQEEPEPEPVEEEPEPEPGQLEHEPEPVQEDPVREETAADPAAESRSPRLQRAAAVRELAGLFLDEEKPPRNRRRGDKPTNGAEDPNADRRKTRVEDDGEIDRERINRLIDGVKGL